MDVEQQKYSLGFALLRRGNVDAAAAVAQELLEEGDNFAWILLGTCYEIGGRGVSRDLDLARDCFQKACDAVDAAEAWLGIARVEMMTGGPEAYGRAFRAYSELHRHGQDKNPIVLANLGRLLCAGIGVELDTQAGSTFLMDAVGLGNIPARRWLAGVLLNESRYLNAIGQALAYVSNWLIFTFLWGESERLREY